MFVPNRYSSKIGWRSVRRSHSNVGLKAIRLIYLLITVGTIIFILRSSNINLNALFPIKYDCVVVEGISKDSFEWCRVAIEDLNRKNILFVSSPELKLSLANQFSSIKDVVITKKLPFSVSLTIYGRKPIVDLVISDEVTLEATVSGIWEARNSYLLDESGYILNKELYVSKDLPFILDNNEPVTKNGAIDDTNFLSILDTISKLKKVSITITKVDTVAFPNIKIYLSGNTIVHLLGDSRFHSRLNVLQMILEKYRIEGKMLKSIDLRYSEPVVSW